MNYIKTAFVALIVLTATWVSNGQSIDLTPKKVPATTTTTTTTPPTTKPAIPSDPSPVQDWPNTYDLSPADRDDALDALLVIQDHDPERLEDMLAIEWQLAPCISECAAANALAETNPYSCVTKLDIDAIYREADLAFIQRSYWLASTLVHERAHCDTEGMDDELHSLAEERAFVETWEPDWREAGIKAMDQLDSQIDKEGKWIEE
jgi:hypothetical protein